MLFLASFGDNQEKKINLLTKSFLNSVANTATQGKGFFASQVPYIGLYTLSYLFVLNVFSVGHLADAS
jgi:hypothetical protein